MTAVLNGIGPTGFNKTTSTTLAMTGVAVSAGSTLVVCAFDHVVGSTISSVADSKGNTYVVPSNTRMWAIGTIATALLSTDTVTVTFAASNAAHAGVTQVWTGLSTTVDDTAAHFSNGTGIGPDVFNTPNSAGSVVFAGVGVIGPSTDTSPTFDNDATGGVAWDTTAYYVGSSGAGATSNSVVFMQSKNSPTAGVQQEYNPALSTSRTFLEDTLSLLVSAPAATLPPPPHVYTDAVNRSFNY